MKLRLSHEVVAAPIPADRPLEALRRSRVPEVAAMFGLGPSAAGEPRPVVIVPDVELDLRPGQVVFITGPSGGGKSTLLRLIDHAATRAGAAVVRFDTLPPPPDEPLVDALADHPLERVLHALGLAGLGDAFIMLRRPTELSDGQRYRLRVAQTILALSEPTATTPLSSAPHRSAEPTEGIADVSRHRAGAALPCGAGGDDCNRRDDAAQDLVIVLADEFGATLDRVTAQAVARNVRRWVRQTRVCFVAATTHDDLLEPLDPDVLIDKTLDGGIQVLSRPSAPTPTSTSASPPTIPHPRTAPASHPPP